MDTKPLLSDQRIRDIETGRFASERMYGMNYQQGIKDARDIYEAARAEDAELIQTLVDALKKIERDMDADNPTEIYLGVDAALSAAAARNFKPSQP